MDAAHKPEPAEDIQSRTEPDAEPVAIADERLDKLQEPALAEAAAQLIRRGAIVLALFNLLALAIAPLWGAYNPPWFVVLGFVNSAFAFAFAMLTFRDWFRRHWRIATLIACAELIGSATLAYTLNDNTGVLLLDLSLVVIGASALVPWAPRWQALLAGLALLAAGAHFVATSGGESAPVEHVFGLIFSVIIGQLIASLQGYYRREIARAFAELQASHDRLRTEMSLRELAAHEREAAQSQLRESEQALRTIFDVTVDMIAVNRISDGAYLDANRAFFDSGFTLDEMQQRAEQGISVWIDPAQRDDFWRQIRDRGHVHNMEARLRRKDGGTSYNLVSAVTVELRGEPCVVTFIRNINELKEAERKIRESEQSLRAIFDASLDAISVARASDGRYVEVNREFLTRWPGRADIIGSTDLDLGVWVHPEERAELTRQLDEAGEVRNMEVEFYAEDGRVESHLLSAARVTLRGEPCIIAFTRNIADLKEAERRIRESEATLRQVFDAIPDAVIIARMKDASFVDANAGLQALGMTREDALSGRHLSLIHI